MAGTNLLSKLEEDIQYAKSTGQMLKEGKQSTEALLSENLKYSQAIYADTQKIRRYMFWRMIISIIWIIIIVVPTVLSFIYLQPFIKQYWNSLQQLTGTGQSSLDLINQLNQVK